MSHSWVGTAYVLVTLVSGLAFGEPFDNGNPNAKNKLLYRIERDGTPTLIADLGQWSAGVTRHSRRSSSTPACISQCSRTSAGFW